MLEAHGYTVVGFCGLKDYQGKKKIAPKTPAAAPASHANPPASTPTPSTPPAPPAPPDEG